MAPANDSKWCLDNRINILDGIPVTKLNAPRAKSSSSAILQKWHCIP